MLKQVYEIYTDGYLKEIYVADVNEENEIIDEDKRHMISVPMQDGLKRPKFNGNEWIEGESTEEKYEREAIERLNALQPSTGELEDAKIEIKILTLLNELEMI